MRINIIAAVALAVATSGCATATRGTTETVTIQYAPAHAKAVTSLNHTCTSSPCSIEVSRKKAFTVTASAPGYQSQTVAVKTKVSKGGAAGVAGNVLIGGVIGIGVDAATGAALDHYPNPVIMKLKPVGGGANLSS